jgi:hypothetical protein
MAGTLLISARKESRAILPAAKDGGRDRGFPQLERKKGQADETTWPFG